MSRTETVTGKIPSEYKRLLKEHGVNISKLIRDAVEKEIDRITEEEQRKALNAASLVLQKIPDQEIKELIGEGRDMQ